MCAWRIAELKVFLAIPRQDVGGFTRGVCSEEGWWWACNVMCFEAKMDNRGRGVESLSSTIEGIERSLCVLFISYFVIISISATRRDQAVNQPSMPQLQQPLRSPLNN